MPVKSVLLFLAGIGVGSAGTYFAVKKYYENYMDEEIASVKEYYKENIMEIAEREFGETAVNPERDDNLEEPKKDEPDYQGIIQKLNYGDYSKKDDKIVESRSKETSIPEKKEPYVIEPDDFTNDSQYDKITLTYFSEDGVFMSIEEEVVPEGMQLVGEENLEHIGEIEEDVVYIRNEEQGADYEVILEERSYSDSEYAAGNYED